MWCRRSSPRVSRRRRDRPSTRLLPNVSLHLARAEDAGLLHLQMATFARIMEQARSSGAWETYELCVRLADALCAHPDPVLLNALNVSFFEHLEFDGEYGSAAWSRSRRRSRADGARCRRTSPTSRKAAAHEARSRAHGT